MRSIRVIYVWVLLFMKFQSRRERIERECVCVPSFVSVTNKVLRIAFLLVKTRSKEMCTAYTHYTHVSLFDNNVPAITVCSGKKSDEMRRNE